MKQRGQKICGARMDLKNREERREKGLGGSIEITCLGIVFCISGLQCNRLKIQLAVQINGGDYIPDNRHNIITCSSST